MNGKHVKFLLWILAAIILLPCGADAHRLNVYAWLENDNIVVDCNFGGNRPAAHADVSVKDNSSNNVLVTGKTDERGQFSFAVPTAVRQGRGLLIEVNAGQGHRNEWTLDAPEIYTAASLAAGFDQAAAKGEAAAHAHLNPKAVTPNNIAMPSGLLSEEEARTIIKQCLEEQLAPIRQLLAARAAAGPTLAEIIGGIGWIMGLVGIGLYFKSRKA